MTFGRKSSHQFRENVNALRRAGRRCGNHSIFLYILQPGVDTLRFEGGERDRISAAIEEQGLPTVKFLISLDLTARRENAHTLKTIQSSKHHEFLPLPQSSPLVVHVQHPPSRFRSRSRRSNPDLGCLSEWSDSRWRSPLGTFNTSTKP